MTRAQLISQLLDAAKDVVKSYWTDLTHDVRLIAEAENGSSFLWAPREYGSFIILLQRSGRPNQRAAGLFATFNGSEAELHWHRIVLRGDPNGDMFDLIPADRAQQAANAMTDLARIDPSQAVSELHM